MPEFTPAYPLSDEETVRRARLSVELALMEQRALGVPVIEYDPETGKIFKVYNDGTRVEVDKEKVFQDYEN